MKISEKKVKKGEKKYFSLLLMRDKLTIYRLRYKWFNINLHIFQRDSAPLSSARLLTIKGNGELASAGTLASARELVSWPRGIIGYTL